MPFAALSLNKYYIYPLHITPLRRKRNWDWGVAHRGCVLYSSLIFESVLSPARLPLVWRSITVMHNLAFTPHPLLHVTAYYRKNSSTSFDQLNDIKQAAFQTIINVPVSTFLCTVLGQPTVLRRAVLKLPLPKTPEVPT